MEYCGCRPLEESWCKRSFEDAFSIIQSGFTFDLSDTTHRLIDDKTGLKYTNDFMSNFDRDKIYFSNTLENPWQEYWNSTSFTADSVECGIVAMDKKK